MAVSKADEKKPSARPSGKRSLKQFYTQLLNLPGRDSARARGAGEGLRQTLPGPKEKPAPPLAAAAKTPVPSREPSPPKPPPVIPPVPLTSASPDRHSGGKQPDGVVQSHQPAQTGSTQDRRRIPQRIHDPRGPHRPSKPDPAAVASRQVMIRSRKNAALLKLVRSCPDFEL
jgi:hypothetical protein